MGQEAVRKAESVKAQNGLRTSLVSRFLGILDERRREIEKELGAHPGIIGVQSDPSDAATCHESLHYEAGMRSAKRSELERVKASIARIRAETYGKCLGEELGMENEKCTGRIELKQLEGCPTAFLCQHCLRERLAKENHRRGLPRGAKLALTL